MSETKVHLLHQARKKLGIKQKVLADLTGLSEPTIKRAERNLALDDYTISAICEFFSTRWGRQVNRQELGLHAKWENSDSPQDHNFTYEEKEVLALAPNERRQLPTAMKEQTNTNTTPSTKIKETAQTVNMPLSLTGSIYNSSMLETLSVGGLTINLIVLARGRYSNEQRHRCKC